MKKLVLLLMTLIFCTVANAQEPEKKKETKTSNGNSQERAINESGISVKSKPQTKSNSKTIESNTPAVEDKKGEEQPKDTKKPN